MSLTAWTAPTVKSVVDSKVLHRNAISMGQAGMGGIGGGGTRRWLRPPSTATAGITNRPGLPERWKAAASRVRVLSAAGQSWQPAAHQAEFTVSNVSWGPTSALFDELVAPAEPEPEAFAEEPDCTLEQVSNRWVSPAVIGAGGGVRQ